MQKRTIREIRKSKFISSSMMANELLISRDYYTRLEKHNGFNSKQFARLCDFLQIKPEEIEMKPIA